MRPLLALFLSLIPLPALAVPLQYEGRIYYDDLPAGQFISITYVQGRRDLNPTADQCGRITISSTGHEYNPNSRIAKPSGTGNQGDYLYSELPQSIKTRCFQKNGIYQHSDALTIDYVYDGKIISHGYQPGQKVKIVITNVALLRRVKVNQCGFIRLTGSDKYSLSSGVIIEGRAYSLTDLPTRNPPRCFKGVLYLPTEP